MKVYEFRVLGDVEGRSVKIVGYFRNRVDAERLYLSGYGNYGNSLASAIREAEVWESVEEFAATNRLTPEQVSKLFSPEEAKRMLRKQALAKLHPDEIRALGF